MFIDACIQSLVNRPCRSALYGRIIFVRHNLYSSDSCSVLTALPFSQDRNPAALINISRVAKISLVTSRLDSWLWELHPIYIFLQLLFIYAYKMFGRNPRRMFSYLGDISNFSFAKISCSLSEWMAFRRFVFDGLLLSVLVVSHAFSY
jgi:hypothetical protein